MGKGTRGRRPNIYMAVSSDKYETPLFVSDSAKEMAAFLHCSEDSFYSRISKHRSGRIRGLTCNAIVIHSIPKEKDDYEED